MTRSAIATALALAMGADISHALDMNSATFDMYDATGALINVDDKVTGFIDTGAGTWGVASTVPFNGALWNAHDGTLFTSTFTVDTMKDETPFPSYTGVQVGTGQIGGHILFDWGAVSTGTTCGLVNCNIDVINVWDVADGSVTTYTSIDVDGNRKSGAGVVTDLGPNGTPGLPMIDGAFPGFSANFTFNTAGPPAARDDNKSTAIDTPVNIDVVANDSAAATTATPPDETAVNPAAVPPAIITIPAATSQGGTLAQPTPEDGTVNYTPPSGFTGPDSFTYTLTDDIGRESAAATVSITVTLVANTPPVANDTTITTDEELPIDIPVDSVASDDDGDNLTFAAFETNTANGGTVTVDGTQTVLTYTPAIDFNGTDSFNYSVTDSVDNSNNATITVIVNPINDSPVCTDVGLATEVDTALLIDVESDLLSTCTDADDDPITLVTVSNPTQPGSTTSYDGVNTVTYTPATGFEGEDTFTYTATDGTANDTKTVAVQVSGKIFGNFTMIDAAGTTFGGTNDIVADWDGTLNTSETSTNFNMTIESDSNFPFFGFPWFAHHIRVFRPGTYEFDTTCTTDQLEAGTADCGGGPSAMLPLTIPVGQIGAQVLFDWNITENIDVVLLWENDGSFDSPPPGALYQGPAGPTPDLNAVFQLISRDADEDGVPGAKMIDGPFIDFQANFNLNFTKSGDGGEIDIPESSISSPNLGSSTSGCSIGKTPRDVLNGGDWLVLSGFIAWLGVGVSRRRREKLHRAT